jgi:amidohydrolase
LSFEEKETHAFIWNKLKELGINQLEKIAGYGIVGVINGKNPNEKVIGLRADIDALPILEKNEVNYASKNLGVMHACGHDVHTTCLLSALEVLNETKADWNGSVKFLFQPAEERLPGGASLMIKEGALQNPEVSKMYGQHVHPPLHVGKLGMRGGMYMASADEVFIEVFGKGGHGALPHNAFDPITASARIISSLQELVSRHSNPFTPSVLTIGKINSDGGSTNIIPDRVKMEGTFRTMDEKWRMEAHRLIYQNIQSTAEASGCKVKVEVRKGYPFLINDEKTTQSVFSWAEDYVGKENVVELPPRMSSEDFSYYTQEVPSCFWRLGTGNPKKGITSSIHTPTFDVDEKAISIGGGFMAYSALKSLGN